MHCPKCEKELKKNSIQCPHCGVLIPRQFRSKTVEKAILPPKACAAVGLLLAFIGVILLFSHAESFAMLPIVVGGVLIFIGLGMGRKC